MEFNIINELSVPEINQPNSQFQEISIDFGKIEGIDKDAEAKLNQLFTANENEVSKLMSSVFDVNQIFYNPKYISKLVEKKIKKIFSFIGFFIYFKKEPAKNSKK